jgi:hypothetical protein
VELAVGAGAQLLGVHAGPLRRFVRLRAQVSFGHPPPGDAEELQRVGRQRLRLGEGQQGDPDRTPARRERDGDGARLFGDESDGGVGCIRVGGGAKRAEVRDLLTRDALFQGRARGQRERAGPGRYVAAARRAHDLRRVGLVVEQQRDGPDRAVHAVQHLGEAGVEDFNGPAGA